MLAQMSAKQNTYSLLMGMQTRTTSMEMRVMVSKEAGNS